MSEGVPEIPSVRILTWNVNGIRSLYKDANAVKAGLDALDADIICFQETKTARDCLDQGIAIVEGYNSYWGFPRNKSGYSGVATYCKNQYAPFKAEEGLSGLFVSADATDSIGCYGNIRTEFSKKELKELDYEGRAVITLHKMKILFSDDEKLMVIINVYCPRAACDNPERLRMKLRFYKLLEMRAQALSDNGYFVIIVGDFNVWHKPIDHCEPPGEEQIRSDPCHTWLDQFVFDPGAEESNGHLDGYHLIDAFRFRNPEEENAFTCWSSRSNARSTNYGARIDYILIDMRLGGELDECAILKDILGSDHCPVKAVINMEFIGAPGYPSFCTSNYHEFVGTQQKMVDYFFKIPAGESAMISKQESDDVNVRVIQTKVDTKKQRSITSFFKAKQGECSAQHSSVESVSSLSSLSSPDSAESISSEAGKLGACSLSILNEAIEAEESAAAKAWKQLLTGPKEPPKCSKHQEPCIPKIVRKKGPNINRKFWICNRGEGRASDPNARCDYFKWDSDL